MKRKRAQPTQKACQKIRTDIDNKIAQLQSPEGLTIDDQEILKERLAFLWGEPEEPDVPSTRSRHNRARAMYKMVQDASTHLFLAVLLAVPPTIAISPEFQSVFNQLLGLESYDMFRFQLDAKAQRFFATIAAEQGFTMKQSYKSLLDAMFSEPEARREFTLSCFCCLLAHIY